MKSYREVQRTRENYHQSPLRKAVHRSSLLVPELGPARACISFLNHFLLKRQYGHVACKISAVDERGLLVDSITLPVTEPRVYAIELASLFDSPANAYMVEFFCSNNLFIPFPAVMVNHAGDGFVNSLHAYNRVFNDVFEDDAVNKIDVAEASTDVEFDEECEPFFVFGTGIQPLKGAVTARLDGPQGHLLHTIDIDSPKLTHRIVPLGAAFGPHPDGRVLRLQPPTQFMFYGRLLAGIRHRETGAFAANHTYYDSSSVREYWPTQNPSYRTYPFLPGLGAAVRVYPIASPGTLRITVEVADSASGKSLVLAQESIQSPGGRFIDINVSELASAAGISPSAFCVRADPVDGNTPTRICHQLVYFSLGAKSKLQASMSVSLASDDMFLPKGKKGQIWGQIIVGDAYTSGAGFSFNSASGQAAEIAIEFFCEAGKFHDVQIAQTPGTAYRISGAELLQRLHEADQNVDSFATVWYMARSSRPDLAAFSAHAHRTTGHASGEHNF